VRLGRNYELACSDKSCTFMTKEMLLEPQDIAEDVAGGEVVEARLVKRPDGTLRVEPLIWKKKERWTDRV
jgi:hypothetical protein